MTWSVSVPWEGIRNIIGAVLYLSAIGLAVYSSRKKDWSTQKIFGTVIFLVGLGFVIFLDEAVTILGIGLPFPMSWIEWIGTGILILGVLMLVRPEWLPYGKETPE